MVMASGMATVFSTPVSASGGSFTPPTTDQICAALDKPEEALAYVTNAYFKALLEKAIEAPRGRYGCQ